jgi:hypothetical protein
MSAPAVSVGIALGIPDAGDFIVGTSLVDGPDVVSDGRTTITNTVNRVSIRRGRTGRLTDPIDAASVTVVMNNENRHFDPAYAAGPYFGSLVPSREIAIDAGGVRIFTGFIEDWDLDYDVSGRSTAAARCTDALGILAQTTFTAWTNAGTTGGTKLANICDRPEVSWPAPLRVFDDSLRGFAISIGLVEPLLQVDNVSWGSNVLNYCQLIARSEMFSLLYATASGVLRYRQFNNGPESFYILTDDISSGGFDPLLPPSAATFGGAGIPFQSIARGQSSDMLFSSVSVDREGGTAQTSTVANPTTWRNTYGPLRRLTIGETLLSRDVYASIAATAILRLVDDPTDVINTISVELAALSGADQVTVLGLDIGDTVTVTFTPNGVGSAITQNRTIQGISHDITPESHTVTFSLFNYFRPT